MQVLKRDGVTHQDFVEFKIVSAVTRAGLDPDLASFVLAEVGARVQATGIKTVTVEAIQDIVEKALMTIGAHDVAKAYVLYREERRKVREKRAKPDSQALAEYIHHAKDARYLPDKQRRETLDETVDRFEAMHLKKFPFFADKIKWACQFVRERKIFGSRRTMQFGGKAIEEVNARAYNCSFSLVDRPEVFSQAFYLLLTGTGVGFSVQFEHVEQLPEIKPIETGRVQHVTVEDNIAGWADALDALINAYMFSGNYVEFNFSKIRAEGTPLKTSGGKAPGHVGLKIGLEAIRKILDDAVGRKLRPIECYDIFCLFADAVLSGGIRRSSLICLFSLDDSEMMNAKTGKWYQKYPWRSNSNNSAVCVRGQVRKTQFLRIFSHLKQWGEPGFAFLDDISHGLNPCCEIGLDPVLIFKKIQENGFVVHEKYTGFAFCNLCTINGAKLKTKEDFENAAHAAVILGTVQASYTDFSYLGPVTEKIAQRDALLGISITGMMDSPGVTMNPVWQREIAQKCVEWNKEYAALLGINQAARVTCVKPEGTASLAFGGTGSGIHARHARRYIRRVTANEHEAVFQFFKSVNPHMCVKKPDGDWVIEFPIESPPDAVVKSDLEATQFLEIVRQTQLNWVLPGTARTEDSPGLHHNVSNTCQVKDSEWEEVAEYLWNHQSDFTAVSFIPDMGDKLYSFAPHEAIVTSADEAKWNHLIQNFKPVDYRLMIEDEDNTQVKQEIACAGGKCELA